MYLRSLVLMFPNVSQYLHSPIPLFTGTYVSQPLSSFVPMFPYIYVPWYLCSTVPMFPSTYFPHPNVSHIYIPRSLVLLFSCTYVPTLTVCFYVPLLPKYEPVIRELCTLKEIPNPSINHGQHNALEVFTRYSGFLPQSNHMHVRLP